MKLSPKDHEEIFNHVKNINKVWLEDDSYSSDQMLADLKKHEGTHDTTKCRFCKLDNDAAEFVLKKRGLR